MISRLITACNRRVLLGVQSLPGAKIMISIYGLLVVLIVLNLQVLPSLYVLLGKSSLDLKRLGHVSSMSLTVVAIAFDFYKTARST